MRGRGLFDWFTGSTGPAGPAGPAGYSAVSQEESEPTVEFLPNVEFSDANGKRGRYTGYAINLNGVYFRKDPFAIMDYGNGIKYIGSFDRNMKNGQGTYYNKNIQLTGEWRDDKPVDVKQNTYYPELLEKADDATTGYKGRFDPRSISAMPAVPEFRPKSTL